MTIQQEKHLGKEPYAAPEVEVLEVKSEGIICGSNDPKYSNPWNPEKSW